MLFLYRLALKLGIWNVEGPGGLADQMPWWQLERWMAAFQLMPWGDEWLRDAVVMCQNYNVNRPKGKNAMQVHEFMPVKPRTTEQTPEQIWTLLASIPNK
jgi:hypothetical protein